MLIHDAKTKRSPDAYLSKDVQFIFSRYKINIVQISLEICIFDGVRVANSLKRPASLWLRSVPITFITISWHQWCRSHGSFQSVNYQSSKMSLAVRRALLQVNLSTHTSEYRNLRISVRQFTFVVFLSIRKI